MNTSGIYITADHLKSLSRQDQEFLFRILRGQAPTEDSSTATFAPDPNAGSGDEHFAELSPGQARDFYAGCSSKTRKAIDVIADSNSPRFQLADVAKAVGVQPSKLGNVFGGLTRRVKTITGDGDAYLIDWTKGDPVVDEDGNYLDQAGEVSELTYHSFRKALRRS